MYIIEGMQLFFNIHAKAFETIKSHLVWVYVMEEN